MADNVIQIIIRAKDEAQVAIQRTGAELNKLGPIGQAVSTRMDGLAGVISKIPPVAIVAAGAVVAVGAAALVAGRALADAATEGGRFADDMGTLADRAGVAVEDFTRLSFAAGQFDATTGDLSAALKFMNRNLFEAQAGSKEAEIAFVALGLSAEQLAKLDPGESFLRIVDALSKVEDKSARLAIGTRILGRGFEALLPAVEAGRATIEGFGRELDRVGGTVTTRSAQIGDDYDNAQKRMAAATMGFKVAISELLLPAMTDLVDAVTGVVARINEFQRANTDALEPIREFAAGIADLLKIIDPKNLDSSGINAFNETLQSGIPFLRAYADLMDRVVAARVLLGVLQPSKASGGAAANTFEPGVSGPPTGPPSDPLKVIREFEEQQKRMEEARKAAEAYAKKMAELRIEFEKAAAVAFSIPEGVADKLFEVDPAKAAAAVAILQKAIEGIDAIPIGVSVDGKMLLESLTQAAAGLMVQIQTEIDPEARAKLEKELVEIEARILRVGSGIRQPTGQSFVPTRIEGSADSPLKEERPQFSEEDLANAARFEEIAAQIGISVEVLNDALEESGVQLDSMLGTVVVLGEAFERALSFSFDPLARGIADAQRAAQQFADTAITALDNAIGSFITNAQAGFRTLGGLMKSLGEGVASLVKQIIVLTIRTLILKAISGGLFSGGGQIVQTIQESSGGGRIRQSLAAGGAAIALSGAFVAPSFASGGPMEYRIPAFASGSGLGAVPGANSNRDSVLAHLAPGEYVLTNRGGMNPTHVVERLATLSTMIQQQSRETGSRASGGRGDGPIVGEVHIHAPDWESWRNQARPGGRLADALELGLELGR